jgi:hypothetical protein
VKRTKPKVPKRKRVITDRQIDILYKKKPNLNTNEVYTRQENNIMSTAIKATGVSRVAPDSDYFSLIASIDKGANACHMPLYANSPSCAMKKTTQFQVPVNSSGNLFVFITPSLLSWEDSAGNVSPGFIISNNAGYTDVNGSGNIITTTNTAIAGLHDSFTPPRGDMHSWLTTAFQLQWCVTGVSITDLRGYVNAAILTSDTAFVVASSGSANGATALQTLMNSNPVSNAVKNPQHMEYDLSKDNDNKAWRFVPNFGPESADLYERDVTTQSHGTMETGTTNRSLALYFSGLNPSSIVKFNVAAAYSANPIPSKKSDFTLSFTNNFRQPLPLLVKMACNTDFCLTRSSEMHLHTSDIRNLGSNRTSEYERVVDRIKQLTK